MNDDNKDNDNDNNNDNNNNKNNNKKKIMRLSEQYFVTIMQIQ